MWMLEVSLLGRVGELLLVEGQVRHDDGAAGQVRMEMAGASAHAFGGAEVLARAKLQLLERGGLVICCLLTLALSGGLAQGNLCL
jgi:hypothetical protein